MSEELAKGSAEVANASEEVAKGSAGNAKASAELDMTSEELAKGSEEVDMGSAGNVGRIIRLFCSFLIFWLLNNKILTKN